VTKLTCTTCKQTKPVDEFGVRSSAANGRRSQCKACYRAQCATQPSRHVRPPKKPVEPTLPTAAWLVEREEWQQQGRCHGKDKTSVFFPPKGGNNNLPKLICQGCPVQFQCLEYAVRTNQRFGIWGGKSEKERRIIRKRRRQTEQVAS
jgi:WhiB family redox-sensing transcriptional regulator